VSVYFPDPAALPPFDEWAVVDRWWHSDQQTRVEFIALPDGSTWTRREGGEWELHHVPTSAKRGE
jgi:hypothetical protein